LVLRGLGIEVYRRGGAAFGDEVAGTWVRAEDIRRGVECAPVAGNHDAAAVTGSGPSAEGDTGPSYACPSAGTEERPHAHAHARVYGSPNEREAR
jgi:hypothetical protein